MAIAFSQTNQQFEEVKKAAIEALRTVFPVKGKRRSIVMENAWAEDNLDSTDYKGQASAKQDEATWGVPVYAHLKLVDNTGGVVDENKKVRLFNLPKPTQRHSFIVKGNEYQVHNQLRLKPGVYTIRKQNGELKTQLNLARGKNFDLVFDENKAIFFISKVAGGQANIQLYPILLHLGISRADIAKAWGERLVAANEAAQDPKAVDKLESALGLKRGVDLKSYLQTTQISPETTKEALGRAFTKVDGLLLLASSKNLLEVHQGKKEATDRDSLEYKELHGLDDFIKERLEKNAQGLSFKLLRNVDNLKRTRLNQIVSQSPFTSVVESFFTQDDKSATPEQTNPLEMLSGTTAVTFMGAGGIGSTHAITPEMRQVHSSHFGLIDPVHTPECYDSMTQVFTKNGWKFWRDVSQEDGLACLIEERLEFHKPEKLHKSKYTGVMYGVENGKLNYLVTPNHRMLVCPLDGDGWRIELAEDTHLKPRTFRTTHEPYRGKNTKYFELEKVSGGNAVKNVDRVPIEDWCEFMGWYISEGCVTYREDTAEYLVRISQNKLANPENCAKIEALLNRLPWKWNNDSNGTSYGIGSKQLAKILSPQKDCSSVFIPEELLHAPLKARRKLFDAMMAGDGRKDSSRKTGVFYKQQVYCTTSQQLSKDFERLAVGLGYSVSVRKYSDKREERYLDVYEIRILQRTRRSARRYNNRRKCCDYYTTHYDGFVYCATVPGGLLLVKRQDGVAIWLGNSDRVGVNLHVPLGAVKDGKDLKMSVVDNKGNKSFLTAIESKSKYIGFPNQSGNVVKAMYKGQIVEVPRSQIDYWVPDPTSMYSWSTNLIPFLPSAQGNRAMMAAKMQEQAISLKNREAPLVQTATPNGKTFAQVVGEQTSVLSPVDGKVTEITDDSMTVGGTKVNLYNNFALNRKSFLHHTPVVKVGDVVKKGQLLADSNYTKNGVLALGANMKTAYIAYKGLNFDDGIVISESASKKLTSEHIYQKELAIYDNIVIGIDAYRGFYPTGLTPDNLAKMDKDGVIKKGSVIKYGEALIAALQKRTITGDISKVSKVLSERPKDVSIHWTLEDSGRVIDVIKKPQKITVVIKTEEATKIGDKLAGLHGNKGVVAKVLPDAEMPRTKEGTPVEVLLNPMGIVSRINVSQTYESATGKIANKLGKPIIVSNFDGSNNLKQVKDLISKTGVHDKEELFDKSGKSLGEVHVGMPHILKLFKQSQGNYSVRQGGPGHGYDANMQPLKAGGEEGAKTLDPLTMYSMLSHGARANIREMASIKSTRNDEFWKALKAGELLPPPQPSFAFDKFLTYLKGAGIDVKKDGSRMALAPFTDKHVESMSSFNIKEPFFYRAKDFEPIKGGFFDKTKLGGFHGNKWGHIELAEPVINPVFENAVRKLTGLGTKFNSVISGESFVDASGNVNKEGKGLTGGAAIGSILDRIDVDKDIAALKEKAKKAKGATLDDINKKLRYLLALKNLGMKPSEAYMRSLVPVVPSQFRPVYPLPNGNMATSDINMVYKNLAVINKVMKSPVMDLLGDEHKSEIRKDLYEHVKGVTGLTDVNIQGKPREGFISAIKGGEEGQPKEGFFISKLLSKRQDYVGRGTALPDPDLGLDEIGIPETMAWKLFEPFIVRELKNFGKSPLQAMEEIKQKSPVAKRALDIIMEKRHLLLNRAPSLHKFSIMALKPVISSGKTVKVNPLINRGLNLDHDGDTVVIHTPITEEANTEAAKMLPSRNLFQPGTGKLMIAPSQEAQIGIYYLSKTPEGLQKLNAITGPKFPVTKVLDKKGAAELLTQIAHEATSAEFSEIVKKLKSAGEEYAYKSGFSIGVNDLHDFSKERAPIIAKAKELVATSEDPMTATKEVTKLIDGILSSKLKDKGNPFFDQIESGAKGDPSQLRSIMFSPMFVADARNKVVKTPISKSYSEGLTSSDYWISMYGARKGMMDRAISTSLPGAFSKDVMNTTIDNVISMVDCGTKNGVVLPITSKDVLERFTAGDQYGLHHNTLVDQNVVNNLKRTGAVSLKVRSPLKCMAPKGTCAHCYGLDEHKAVPEVGENVGAKSGQTISEPLVQIAMNCSVGNIVDADGKCMSFEDFYDAQDVEEALDGDCYTKQIDSTVIDCSDCVSASSVQKHPAHDEMLFIKTKKGHVLLVQANHPLWVYTGSAETPIEIEASLLQKKDVLKVDLSHLSGDEEPPFDPYFIGRYLADGSTRVGNGTEKYNGVPVSTIVTGADLAIKEKTLQSSQGMGRASKKDVQIYSPKFAATFSRIARGNRAWKKRLMPGFNRWSKDSLEKLLAGYIDGDGSVYMKDGVTTCVNIYTSSFVLLQQIQMICFKLGVSFCPGVVPRQKLQHRPQFIATLRFEDEGVRQHSIKMQRVEFSPQKTCKFEASEFDYVTYIKPLWSWEEPVYDIKTSSRGFTCGTIRNHNSFHTGGAAGTGAQAGGFQRINQLLSLPKVIAGAATLSPVEGKITKIVKGIAGGFDVFIDDHKAHVSQGNKPIVTVGQLVEKGDALSDGPVRPQDLAQLKGVTHAQDYIADHLQETYKQQGIGINRKTFETVVRSLTNTTQVQKAPEGTPWIPGDIIPLTVANHYNENLIESVDVHSAIGLPLAESVGGLRMGHVLTAGEAGALESNGIHQVKVRKGELVHKPFVKGLQTLPLLKQDWMAALGYRNLAKALTEGASQGWQTDIEGYHPLPALAHGTTFGKGKEGRY